MMTLFILRNNPVTKPPSQKQQLNHILCEWLALNNIQDRFLRVLVELGYVIEKAHPALKGLTAGPIVIDSDFHLNNERKLAELE